MTFRFGDSNDPETALRGLLLAAVGIGIGLAGGTALTRIIASQLYGVASTDPVTFILVSFLLAAVAAIACWFPAHRATMVDPAVALRHE